MAEVRPLRALHPAPERLAEVIAPPYDVIGPAERAALLARSDRNVVAIDLPEDQDYAAAARTLAAWRADGTLERDDEPAVYVLAQTFTGPDGHERTRTGFLARTRIAAYGPGGVRPHERTHPGPRQDRLALTRATRAQLSPIFALHADPTGGARAALARVTATAATPWAQVTTDDGTDLAVWRVVDAPVIAELERALAPEELLIADGHHRYETARVHADEIGGEGPHRYVLTHLVALEDPGLAVFPTHRLVRGRDPERHEALAQQLRRDFDVEEVPLAELAPPPGRPGDPDDRVTFGYVDAHFRRGFRLTAKEAAEGQDGADPLAGLDAAVLERTLLKGPLGLTDAAIDSLDGLGYARDAREAVELVMTGAYDLAFLLRPTPVEQVRAVAAAGLVMPPKSTYFFPKVPTGVVLNPLDPGE